MSRPTGAGATGEADDPTQNVLNLVRAEGRRQDDLRQAERELRRAESRRQDDLLKVWADRLTEVAAIRHHYEGDLRQAETARIDAIREVDQAQVQRTADTQATTAGVLAAQVAAAAEAVRTSMASVTQAQDAKMDAGLDPMRKDIADLRKTQYEQAGQRAQVTESGTGNRAWITIAIGCAGVLVAVSAAFIGAAAVVVTLILRSR